jgi:hypothetical protein
MTKTVRFDGHPADLLFAFGHELAGGTSVEMSDDEAAQLAADPHVHVSVLDDEHEPEADETGEGHDHEPSEKEE